MYVVSTTIGSSEEDIQEQILEEYADFANIFSKKKATGLPPHHTYDCGIDLLPSMISPCGKFYPLSITEQQAMEEYVKEVLR